MKGYQRERGDNLYSDKSRYQSEAQSSYSLWSGLSFLNFLPDNVAHVFEGWEADASEKAGNNRFGIDAISEEEEDTRLVPPVSAVRPYKSRYAISSSLSLSPSPSSHGATFLDPSPDSSDSHPPIESRQGTIQVPQNIVVVRRRRRTSATALGASVPLLLAGGLALGFFAGGLIGDSGALNNTNVINFNGSSLTNTFTPNNSANATNVNNDNDTITSNNQNLNNNTNNARSFFPLHGSGGVSREDVLTDLFRVAGTRKDDFFAAFLVSMGKISMAQVADKFALLARKMWCLRETLEFDADVDNIACLTGRMCCEFFGDNHAEHGGNLLLRLSEVYAAHLLWPPPSPSPSLVQAAAVMDTAVKQQCQSEYQCAGVEDVEECLSIQQGLG